MLLLGTLLALLAAGLWMFALIDVVLTPGPDCRRAGKATWLAIVCLTFAIGAVAWLIFGRPYTPAVRYYTRPVMRRRWHTRRWQDPIGPDAEAALRRHPAGRARDEWTADWMLADVASESAPEPPPMRAAAPDDDPDFLRYLDRVIRDIREAGNGA